jgi:DNA-binding LacI/PurR family transcriptional regulator
MGKREPNGDDIAARVRIHDVAERAGVSIATVSRVLNDHPDVSPATRDEVLRHARELGYTNAGRRQEPIAPHTQLIALSVPSIQTDYVKEIVAGAVEALYHRDARLVICSRENGAADQGLSAHLLRDMTDGALLLLTQDSPDELRTLLLSGYPVVAIDPNTPLDDSIPAVTSTNWAGGKAATEYLISLGHTHIGVITGPATTRVSADRLSGYQAALLAAGQPLLPKLVLEADWTSEGGYRAAQRLLSAPARPTAIFAFNDAMAVGAIRAARDEGIDVPRDLSVVGFDDIDLASLTMPALTTVRQPLHGLGRVGVDMLDRLLHGQPLYATRMELATSLVVRESTAPPHGTSFMT